MFKSLNIGLAIALVFSIWGFNAPDCSGQDVITYYPPAATVGYVPVQRGVWGRRIAIEPVVGYTPGVVTASYSVPVVEFGQPLPIARSTLYTPTVTTYYPPAYYAPVVPVTTYYAPPPVFAPTTTVFYAGW